MKDRDKAKAIEILQQMAENAEASARNLTPHSESDDLKAMYFLGKTEAYTTAIQVVNDPTQF